VGKFPFVIAERSEESSWMVLLKSKWILRFAQNDNLMG
jgi:hypothetical protein